MHKFTATVQILAGRRSYEDDAARAEAAVNDHLNSLPADAALCYGSYMLEMQGEEHDLDAAARWSAIDAECLRIARSAGLAGWRDPDDATVGIAYHS